MNDTIFALPDLGEGLTHAEVVQWHVSEGERVTTDQPLVSVETDKAVVEIPSPRAGVIARLCAAPGERVEVGAALVEFEGARATDAGAIVGDLQASAAPAAGPGSAAAPTAASAAASADAQAATSAPASARAARPARAMPAVRRLAQERGVDLAAVEPTGPGGTITSDDVLRAAGGGRGEPLAGVRRAMAERMQAAHAQVVPATVTGRADIDGWDAPARVMTRLVRAVVAACGTAPALNAWYDAEMQRLQLHDRVDLGIAVDTGDGLFVPVLRDAGARSTSDLQAELDRLVGAVRSRAIEPLALRDATITLSNFGALGGIFATMIVVPPQVAIVGAGRASREPVATQAGLAVRVLLPLSVTFDHRVVTGGEATAFLCALIDDLQRPD